jgi:hypothetical protein
MKTTKKALDREGTVEIEKQTFHPPKQTSQKSKK